MKSKSRNYVIRPTQCYSELGYSPCGHDTSADNLQAVGLGILTFRNMLGEQDRARIKCGFLLLELGEQS